MKSLRLLAAVVLTWLALAAAAAAEDWPNWRGPYFNGSSDETGLPARFSPKEHVRWAAALPGPSAATPIVWKDSVFVSSTDPATEQLVALCLSRTTGKLKWKQVAGSAYQPAGQGTAIQIDANSNYASPSPVTDGKRVIFFYGNGDLAAFDLNGKRLWARNVQKEYGDFCFNWTFGSSPQLYDGRLYLQVLQRDLAVSGRGRDGSASFLLALDPADGKELWKETRPSAAQMESREAYTTPIPFRQNGRREILVMGGDALTGHDAATGKELFRWETWNPGHLHPDWPVIASVVAGGGVILTCPPKREPLYAVKADASGTVGDAGLAWKGEAPGPLTSEVPTPLFYRRRFYLLSDAKHSLSCVDPATGRTAWSTALPGLAMSWASPTGADGKIYVLSLRGDVHVLDAKTGALLATNPVAEGEMDIRSSVAVAHRSLFIRTNTHLYCVGQ
jgi:outer membrane protein assembly factor BamB